MAWPVCRSGLRCCLRIEASTSLLCAPPAHPWEASFSCLYGTLSSVREKILQDAILIHQQLRNSRDNLSSWLEQLPHHQVQPSDGPGQIAYKLQAQKVRPGAMGWTVLESGPGLELGPPATCFFPATDPAGMAACNHETKAQKQEVS